MNVSLPSSLSPPEEAARLRALTAYGILDSPPELGFDRITSLAARVLRAPIALVSLVDGNRQWFKSAFGITALENPRSHSFCAHALGSDAVLVVPDAKLDPRFAENPQVTGEPYVRFYAGAPLLAPRFPQVDAPQPLTRERVRLGTLCIIDTEPRPIGLLPDEQLILTDLAAMVVELLLQRLADQLREEEVAGRKRAEMGWRQSEERYQRLAGNGLGMVYQFTLAPDGAYTFSQVGDGCREVLELPPAMVRRDANALFDLISPEDRAIMRASMQRSAEHLELWRWEGALRLPDGRATKWVVATSCPHRLSDGTVVWDGILTDATARRAAEVAQLRTNRELEAKVTKRTAALGAQVAERRRAELAAQESRTLAVNLLENATDLVFVEDAAGRFQMINPAFARYLGRPTEAILGRNPGDFFDEPTAHLLETNTRRVFESGEAATAEVPVMLADRRAPQFLQVALTPLRDRVGKVTSILGIARDITVRQRADRESEARARQQSAVANLGRRALELGGEDGLSRLLAEATETVARTLEVPFCALVERDSRDSVLRHRAVFGWPAEVIGEPISDSGNNQSGSHYMLRAGGALTTPDLLSETRFAASPEARRRGLRGAMCVVIARRTDGPADGEAQPHLGVLTVHDRRVREWTPGDAAFLQAMANVIAAAMDRHDAEETVEAARREAEGANAAKSEFLSRMSHELRTPLNAILGFSQLLEMDAETVSQRESVEHILRAGRHLLGLIDEVLDISRIESGRIDLQMTAVVVKSVTAEAVAMVRHAAKSRAMTIQTSDGEEDAGEIKVQADPMRLRQVLVNLLTNAVKYNVPNGQVGLRVLHAAGGPTVRVEVWDTGRGIPIEQQPRLFRPFERLGEARGSVEGTGIGLAIAKRLMEAMGGTIGVHSAAGEGSTFWVELPAVAPE